MVRHAPNVAADNRRRVAARGCGISGDFHAAKEETCIKEGVSPLFLYLECKLGSLGTITYCTLRGRL